VHKTSRLLIAHEAVVPFGIGAEIAAASPLVLRIGAANRDAAANYLGSPPDSRRKGEQGGAAFK